VLRAWLVGGALGALTIASVGASGTVSASASVGAGVGASPITLRVPAQPGQHYHLPGLYVVNTGSKASVYDIDVEELAPGQGRPVPPSWIHFATNHFQLAPNGAASVPITLDVPPGASGGRYASDLVASTAAPRDNAGAVAGVRAATQLVFSVRTSANTTWGLPRWSYGALAALALTTAGWLFWRRYGFRIHVERRN
jgi:hypothetical protein